jgi:hypothetical protein
MNQPLRVRVMGVSIFWSMAGGAVVGFVPGMFTGCLAGAALCWGAGAVLNWQRQLGFTLGVTQQLLPFGDQMTVLEQISGAWLLVVPLTGLAVGLLWAMVGAVGGAVASALLGRLEVGVPLIVELDEGVGEEARAGREDRNEREDEPEIPRRTKAS